MLRLAVRSFLCLLPLASSFGCNKETKKPAQEPANANSPVLTPEEVYSKLPGGDEYRAGKMVYAVNDCLRCHRLGESGHISGKKFPGPNMVRLALESHKELKPWIAEHIRNAKQHWSGSSMPEYPPNLISDADLALLTDYLASRK